MTRVILSSELVQLRSFVSHGSHSFSPGRWLISAGLFSVCNPNPRNILPSGIMMFAETNFYFGALLQAL